MDKIITTLSDYNLETHKIILGVYKDENGNEYQYCPERSKREDSICEICGYPQFNKGKFAVRCSC